MHPKFLNLLRCPETGESLALSAQVTLDNGIVWAGDLTAAASGRRYPIVRGVPRFVSKERYAASFGWEWSKWPRVQFEAENVGRPMAGHTTRMWERITGASLDEVHGRTVVEFGCGPGRFLDVVRSRGGVAVGIDMSAAVDAARNNFADDPDVLIVQGDLLRPPFKEGVFDGGFTIGVLHHTPEPAEGLRALARTVRAGGWVSCCVYPKGGFYDYASVRRFRGLHRTLSKSFEYLPALAYTYLAAYVLAPAFQFLRQHGLRRLVDYVERNWLVALWLKDAQWRVLDTFDSITPEIATTHTAGEVREWMAFSGCEDVHRTAWCETSATAVRAVETVIAQEVHDRSALPGREGLVPWFHEDEEEPLTLTLLPGRGEQGTRVAA